MVNFYSSVEIILLLAKIISGLLLTNCVSFKIFLLDGEDYVSIL